MRYLGVPRTDEDQRLEDEAVRRINWAAWAVAGALFALPLVVVLVLIARAGG